MNVKEKVSGVVDKVRTYWKIPPLGKYMTFKEIAAYAVGGIGAYFIMTIGVSLIVGTTNMIVGGAIGIAPDDMYILYLIDTFANIPLTALRANMVDNTRNKAGKYRPYLLSMGIPTALISVAYVWFPYDKLANIVGTSMIFGKSADYIATCAIVLIFNLLLQFYYNFFYDAYTNLIHVLSPNTQERTDVLAVKSVIYSLAPSIVNIALPIVAQVFTNDNLYDIRVYRYSYPIFAIFGIALTILVFANTKEKIVQAKSHTIQIKFSYAIKEVAKNKYFWIISLAGWIGFLESAYGNILTWSYNYGHTANGTQYALIQTLIGNASFWGMLLTPVLVRKWGKKMVLILANFMNIVCILAMLLGMHNIWWLFICVYFNWFVGASEQITAPAIQADIRDYQQYKTGERIDGMFAAVGTIGSIVTLFTSSILPAVQKYYGISSDNGYASPYDILDVNTGEPGLLYKLMSVLIIMAAVGAFLNVVPYFFYDFTEKKQKGVVKVLKIRALFEDYSNNCLKNRDLVDAIDIINEARATAKADYVSVNKGDYKPAPARKVEKYAKGASKAEKEEYKKACKIARADYKASKKQAKKAYRGALEFNENIDISKFVCDELDKFSTPLYKTQLNVYKKVLDEGLTALASTSREDILRELHSAQSLPSNTEEEKELKKFAVETAKKKLSSKKAVEKYYPDVTALVKPDFAVLESLFDEEDALDEKLKETYALSAVAKKEKDSLEIARLRKKIDELKAKKKENLAKQKKQNDIHFHYSLAAKAYNDAERLVSQYENYNHLDELNAMYDEAKRRAEETEAREREQAIREQEEADAYAKKIKAEKKAAKSKKK